MFNFRMKNIRFFHTVCGLQVLELEFFEIHFETRVFSEDILILDILLVAANLNR